MTGSVTSDDERSSDTSADSAAEPTYALSRAARRLGISVSTLDRMIDRGDLQVLRQSGGRGRRIRADQVDRVRAETLRKMELLRWTDDSDGNVLVGVDQLGLTPAPPHAGEDASLLRIKVAQLQQIVEGLAQSDKYKTELLARLALPDYADPLLQPNTSPTRDSGQQ